MLHASMSYVRQFAPQVLGAVRFAGGPGTEQLMAAVEVLSELYAALADLDAQLTAVTLLGY